MKKTCKSCGFEGNDVDFYRGNASTCRRCVRERAAAKGRERYAAMSPEARQELGRRVMGREKVRVAAMSPGARAAYEAKRQAQVTAWKASPKGIAYIDRKKEERRTAGEEARREGAARSREKRRANAKAWARENPDANRARIRRWKEANPHRVLAIQMKRVERQRSGQSTGPAAEEVHQFYKWVRTVEELRCYMCGANVPAEKREVDHVIPLSRHGLHVLGNLGMLCSGCNLLKSNKLLSEMGVELAMRPHGENFLGVQVDAG